MPIIFITVCILTPTPPNQCSTFHSFPFTLNTNLFQNYLVVTDKIKIRIVTIDRYQTKIDIQVAQRTYPPRLEFM